MKLSIVTVCFNAAATIGDTLRSLVSQEGVEREIIVIDGASRDNTMEIVASFGSEVATVVSERDTGIYNAMNKGLARATGDAIAFLNADDFYAGRDVLARVDRAFARSGANIVCGGVQQIEESGKIIRTIPATGFSPWMLEWGKFPPHPGTFVKTDMLRATGGFDEKLRIAADFDIFLRLHEQPGFLLEMLPDVLVKMRVGGISTSGMRAYLGISRDMVDATRKLSVPTNPLKIYARALVKASQYLHR